MVIAKILIGVLILVAGQKFFWFFIGALGFLAGSEVALAFSIGMPYWQVLAVGFICGLLGLVLAVFIEGVAIITAGFLGGAYIFFSLWNFFQFGITGFWWVTFLASETMGSSIYM